MAELDDILNDPSESQKRIKDLSGKVKETSEERDAANAAREAAEAKALEAQRERDFYAGFTDVVATNPQAKDHKDEILAKVKGGYSMEDATVAVLAKAGKLAPAAPPVVDTKPITGGSASTIIPQGGQKTHAEMTQQERRAELEKILDIA